MTTTPQPEAKPLSEAELDEYVDMICDIENALGCPSFGTPAETKMLILSAITDLQRQLAEAKAKTADRDGAYLRALTREVELQERAEAAEASVAVICVAAKTLLPSFEDGRTHSESERALATAVHNLPTAAAAFLAEWEGLKAQHALLKHTYNDIFEALAKEQARATAAEAALAQVERRTPGTYEACPHDGCMCLCPEAWSYCARADCPIRAAASKEPR